MIGQKVNFAAHARHTVKLSKTNPFSEAKSIILWYILTYLPEELCNRRINSSSPDQSRYFKFNIFPTSFIEISFRPLHFKR